MAGLEKKILPYEFLVRWDEQGNLSGAHFVPRQITIFDGETIKDEIANPIPLRMQDGKINTGLPEEMTAAIGDVIGAAMVNMTATTASLTERVTDLEGQLTEAKTGRETAEAALRDLQATVAAPEGEKAVSEAPSPVAP